MSHRRHTLGNKPDFIRSAMQSFWIDPDAWLEGQDRLEAERAAES